MGITAPQLTGVKTNCGLAIRSLVNHGRDQAMTMMIAKRMRLPFPGAGHQRIGGPQINAHGSLAHLVCFGLALPGFRNTE